MIDLKSCPECGVPEYITGEHLWLDNGDIVQKREQRHRLVLIESENLDPLFQNIERIIGASVEPIIISCVRRNIRAYLSLFVPEKVREKIRKKEMSYKPVLDMFQDLARPAGHGSYEFVDMRYEQDENDFCTVSITDAYSLPMCVANHAAAMEAILDLDHDVVYKEAAPGVYNITAFPFDHHGGFKGRLSTGYYHHREGDIELERCAACGGPKALSAYRWRLERGVIENKVTGKHITLFAPAEVDPIFRELETELGETIPQVVVEAQRRFAKTGFFSIGDASSVEDFRSQLALKGLGNLREFKIGKRGLSMRLDNAILHLMIVGMMQGIFETACDIDSTVDWELTEEGNLEVEVKPR